MTKLAQTNLLEGFAHVLILYFQAFYSVTGIAVLPPTSTVLPVPVVGQRFASDGAMNSMEDCHRREASSTRNAIGLFGGERNILPSVKIR